MASLVDGEPVAAISVLDRGLAYGHGVFETIRVAQSTPLLMAAHLQRLTLGCERLKIPVCDEYLEIITGELNAMARGEAAAVLKLIVTAGIGGRGYQIPGDINPVRVITRFALPAYPVDYYQQGIRVRTCDHRLSRNPALAGIKHLNRLEQVVARAEWNDPAIAEGVMLDDRGLVVEGTMSNLFMVSDEKLMTPRLDDVGVRGIMRDTLMEYAVAAGLQVSEGAFPQAELQRADEIFLCNSVIGVWPVTAWDDHRYAIGPVTTACLGYVEKLFNPGSA